MKTMKIKTQDKRHIEIYTDGACHGNPGGVGGWGAHMTSKGVVKELCGGSVDTTNNRMELMGAIQALEFIKNPSVITLYTDSQYVLRGITEWIKGWKAKKWKSSSGSPVKNVDLWVRLDEATQKHDIKWVWVKGHNGNPGNERADWLANKGLTQTNTKTRT